MTRLIEEAEAYLKGDETPVMRRMRIALAEAGYHDVVIWDEGDAVAGGFGVPRAVWWAASELAGSWGAGVRRACWSCWVASGHRVDRGVAIQCGEGRCAHPGVRRWPPRELLVRPAISEEAS